ncbi:hypothetical protein BDW_05905 [Bdellovibrio bacteriovorus W]|nr:hypothetical protein BDW_05905 [Bdellovibrio bacteriovorus W]
MEQNPFSKFYLSAHIRQKREFLGLSSPDIAEALALDQDQYLHMENGELDFSLETLEKLAPILQLQEEDINDLLQFGNIAQANALALQFFEEDTE